MRSSEDYMKMIMKRADVVREDRRAKKQFYVYAVSSAVCLGVLILAAALLPRITDAAATEGSVQRYGSLILSTRYMGYVVIGLIAFGFGILVTLLCSSWRKLNRRNNALKESDPA